MSKLHVIAGAPGGGTSYFTKFLRLNGFYAGKSLEEGKDKEDHLGYLYRRKWHESIKIAEEVVNPLMRILRVSKFTYEQMFSGKYIPLSEHLDSTLSTRLKAFTNKIPPSYLEAYEEEYPDKSIPHGWKNPRNFIVLPFLRVLFPEAKIITVERKSNPNPSHQGKEGQAFARTSNHEGFRQFVYGYKDNFRFQFEDFCDIDKVNELLKFIGLKTITKRELFNQHKELDFDFSKIGENNYLKLANEMSILNQIFDKHVTDKGTTFDAKHGYGVHYDKYFEKFRDKEIKLLEVGIYKGHSVKAWQEYFTKAQIFGIDSGAVVPVNEELNQLDRVRVDTIDVDAPEFAEYVEEHGPFDIIIDDCSHELTNQKVIFNTTYSHLNSGGVYVIEDVGHVPKGSVEGLTEVLSASNITPNIHNSNFKGTKIFFFNKD